MRPDHIDAALRELLDRGVLTPDQSVEVRGALTRAAASRPTRWWAEVAGYLGGVLMAGGAVLWLAVAWENLTDAVRATVLGAAALVLVAAGLVVGRIPRYLSRLRSGQAAARRRLCGLLFALAAGVAAGAAAVLADGREGLAAGATGLVVAAGGYALLRTVPGLLASAAASLLLVTSVMDELGAPGPLAFGTAYLILGAGCVALAAAHVLVPEPVGLGAGAVLALVGAQLPLREPGARGWAYALTFAVAVACFVLYRWLREVVLLVAGVVGVAVAAPEMVWDWTGGAAGGAVILLVAGGALVGASAVGLGLWRTRPDR